MPNPTEAPDIARLRLQDDQEDIFASPESAAKQKNARPENRHDAEEARDARLQAELERVREVNKVIEGVTASLQKAKANMGTVHQTVNNASTLLATWTRILGQTEHNQRLILNPQWQGATQDMEEMENEENRRQAEAERCCGRGSCKRWSCTRHKRRVCAVDYFSLYSCWYLGGQRKRHYPRCERQQYRQRFECGQRARQRLDLIECEVLGIQKL
jgi:hypothetical protein